MASETPNQISLRLMVDKERNRLLFAEAEKEFVDVLLSFLTLPLGTIARLVSKDSNLKLIRFGCISSLYQSVGNMDYKCFCTNTCKEMLLKPRNPMEAHCGNLKINIDDTEPTKYFICPKFECRENTESVLLSTFRNHHKCYCGSNLSSEIKLDSSINVASEGFVQEMVTFIILDDLSVITIGDRYTTLGLLRNLGIKDTPMALTVDITQNEVLDILKCASLSMSKTVLSDIFLHKKQYIEKSKSLESYLLIKGEKAIVEEDNKNVKLKMKLTVRKSNGKVMFAEVEKDFVDVLLSFLTLSVGAVGHILGVDSCFGCLSQLYTSVFDLNCKYFNSEEMKGMLNNPGVAPQFKVNTDILKVHEVTHSKYSCFTSQNGSDISSSLTAARQSNYISYANKYIDVYSTVTLLDPKIPIKGKSNSDGGFVKGPSMYMVTDDLVVKPFSFSSAVSFLNESNVGDDDLEERIISIRVKEVMAILKASVMMSSSALTTALSPFIKSIKEEK
ncbi:DUF674 family protein [Senna tora]|uniref:DUF674 family protein n=1 Tax=Senna tora TaxID=362788 RepID=A0A834TPS2_9FABA|nr:DUF674 family protein [Senna tora]